MNKTAVAAAAWKQAGRNRYDARLNEWATACMVASVTKHGDLRRISEKIGIGEDTAGQLAAAWAIFEVLRGHDASRARTARRLHGYGRFLALGVLWKRYEFDWQAAFEYLESGLKTSAMERQIVDDRDPLPDWHRRGISMYSSVEKLITDLDCPADLRAWAEEGKLILNRLRL